jgi:hypothetical protein
MVVVMENKWFESSDVAGGLPAAGDVQVQLGFKV